MPEPAGGSADLGPLVVAAVRAAVVVRDTEPRHWFSWRWRWEDDLLDRLAEEGSLVRPEPAATVPKAISRWPETVVRRNV